MDIPFPPGARNKNECSCQRGLPQSEHIFQKGKRRKIFSEKQQVRNLIQCSPIYPATNINGCASDHRTGYQMEAPIYKSNEELWEG